MLKKTQLVLILLLFIFAGCSKKDNTFDSYAKSEVISETISSLSLKITEESELVLKEQSGIALKSSSVQDPSFNQNPYDNAGLDHYNSHISLLNYKDILSKSNPKPFIGTVCTNPNSCVNVNTSVLNEKIIACLISYGYQNLGWRTENTYNQIVVLSNQFQFWKDPNLSNTAKLEIALQKLRDAGASNAVIVLTRLYFGLQAETQNINVAIALSKIFESAIINSNLSAQNKKPLLQIASITRYSRYFLYTTFGTNEWNWLYEGLTEEYINNPTYYNMDAVTQTTLLVNGLDNETAIACGVEASSGYLQQ
jgi:hypothetical protein